MDIYQNAKYDKVFGLLFLFYGPFTLVNAVYLCCALEDGLVESGFSQLVLKTSHPSSFVKVLFILLVFLLIVFVQNFWNDTCKGP